LIEKVNNFVYKGRVYRSEESRDKISGVKKNQNRTGRNE